MSTLRCLCLSLTLVGCAPERPATRPPPGATYDFTATLQHTVFDVIVPTYTDLEDNAAALHGAVRVLASAPTEAHLEAARQAWLSTRVPWEQSEGFLYGPVSDLGLDPSLDSWPVDRIQLDQVLASGLELTSSSIAANFGAGLRGFHTIEYLLWGSDEQPARAADLAARPRVLEYLIAASGALEADASTLKAAWVGDDGYGKKFAAAGSPGGVFFRQVDAVQQLLTGLTEICNEVANGKIADPYKAQDRSLEESQFSHNSIRDFADNLRSVKIIYEGSRAGVGPHSLSAFVRGQDEALDARVLSQIDAAILAIEAISSDGELFTSAISNPAKQQSIESAQDAIRALMTTLQRDVLPLIVS